MIARDQFNQGKLDTSMATLHALLEKYPDGAGALGRRWKWPFS